MKKLMVVAVALGLGFVQLPAHAINAHYRDQLIRSGCNEMNAGTTCDINKSREWNERHGNADAPRHGHGHDRYYNDDERTQRQRDRKELNAFLEDSVLGEDVEDARNALFGYGVKRLGPDHWTKNGFDIRLETRNGRVISSHIR